MAVLGRTSLPLLTQPALALQSGAQTGGAGRRSSSRSLGSGRGEEAPLPWAAEEKALPPTGCLGPNPGGLGSPGSRRGLETEGRLTWVRGSGVAQEVGAGDQAVPEAATPTAPHTSVAASDCNTGGGGARRRWIRPPASQLLVGSALSGWLPASPADSTVRERRLYLRGPRAAGLRGSPEEGDKAQADGESGTDRSGPIPRLRAPAGSRQKGGLLRPK